VIEEDADEVFAGVAATVSVSCRSRIGDSDHSRRSVEIRSHRSATKELQAELCLVGGRHARKDPAQYMWVWRRFGRLPPEYPDIYRRPSSDAGCG